MSRWERQSTPSSLLGLGSVALGVLVFAVSCGDASPPTVHIGGTGGSGGTGGMSGSGGAGTGGMVGSGGVGGTGGISGTGGTSGLGGTGGAAGPCATNALCQTCPTEDVCNTDADCMFAGYACVPSGCKTNQGAPIKQCEPWRGGSCTDVGDCPSSADYDCLVVGAGVTRCVRVTPGCDPATESYDCVPGFSCEDGACVDRRVPCDTYLDCPKNYVCSNATFCVHVSRTCHVDADCNGFGRFCADVDGDGRDECTGQLDADACVSSDCTSPGAPVCEAGPSGTTAMCGDYGLCLTNDDCDAGFECLGLWQDGRRECVPINGACHQITDCPLQQVCASPRSGGPPSCQAGSAM